MSKNNKVDTAQKGQTANKIQPEKVQNNLKKIQEIKNAKKDKTPTGKVILISEKESKRKAREEQYRNFRINALKRRADRMGLSKEEVEEAVKKLIEQMDAPKEYNILIMVAKPDIAMLKEALAKEDIKYAFCGDEFVSVNGNQDTLAKIREIAPTSAKIHPHAKKMEPVLPKKEYVKAKKPSNNSKEKALAAKVARKGKSVLVHRNKKTGKVTKRIVLKTLSKARKRKPGTIVHMNVKKSSTATQKASMNLKKAA